MERNRIEFMMPVLLRVGELSDLISQNLTEEEAIEFIKNLEIQYASGEMLEKLYKHFKKEYDKDFNNEDSD